MKKLYDLCVVTSKYTQNGQEKNHYENIGTLWEHESRKFIKLKAHFNPAAITRKEGDECINVSMFAPKDKDNNSSQSNSSKGNNSQEWDSSRNAGYDADDDNTPIPF